MAYTGLISVEMRRSKFQAESHLNRDHLTMFPWFTYPILLRHAFEQFIVMYHGNGYFLKADPGPQREHATPFEKKIVAFVFENFYSKTCTYSLIVVKMKCLQYVFILYPHYVKIGYM